MSGVDWIIVALYCLSLLAIGFFFACRAGRSLEIYFTADRFRPPGFSYYLGHHVLI